MMNTAIPVPAHTVRQWLNDTLVQSSLDLSSIQMDIQINQEVIQINRRAIQTNQEAMTLLFSNINALGGEHWLLAKNEDDVKWQVASHLAGSKEVLPRDLQPERQPHYVRYTVGEDLPWFLGAFKAGQEVMRDGLEEGPGPGSYFVGLLIWAIGIPLSILIDAGWSIVALGINACKGIIGASNHVTDYCLNAQINLAHNILENLNSPQHAAQLENINQAIIGWQSNQILGKEMATANAKQQQLDSREAELRTQCDYLNSCAETVSHISDALNLNLPIHWQSMALPVLFDLLTEERIRIGVDMTMALPIQRLAALHEIGSSRLSDVTVEDTPAQRIDLQHP